VLEPGALQERAIPREVTHPALGGRPAKGAGAGQLAADVVGPHQFAQGIHGLADQRVAAGHARQRMGIGIVRQGDFQQKAGVAPRAAVANDAGVQHDDPLSGMGLCPAPRRRQARVPRPHDHHVTTLIVGESRFGAALDQQRLPAAWLAVSRV
jgi:hypothetical protein